MESAQHGALKTQAISTNQALPVQPNTFNFDELLTNSKNTDNRYYINTIATTNQLKKDCLISQANCPQIQPVATDWLAMDAMPFADNTPGLDYEHQIFTTAELALGEDLAAMFNGELSIFDYQPYHFFPSEKKC